MNPQMMQQIMQMLGGGNQGAMHMPMFGSGGGMMGAGPSNFMPPPINRPPVTGIMQNMPMPPQQQPMQPQGMPMTQQQPTQTPNWSSFNPRSNLGMNR